MKKTFLIALCFALVFILGGFAGWLLKPAPAVAANSAPLSSGEALYQRLDAQLIFTAVQKEKLHPLCLELGKKMDAAGKHFVQRREIFEEYAPRLREQLTPNQLAAYDQMVTEQRTRRARQRP